MDTLTLLVIELVLIAGLILGVVGSGVVTTAAWDRLAVLLRSTRSRRSP